MMPVTTADHEMAMRMRGASFGEIKDLLAEHRGASCASLSSDLQEARAERELLRIDLDREQTLRAAVEAERERLAGELAHSAEVRERLRDAMTEDAATMLVLRGDLTEAREQLASVTADRDMYQGAAAHNVKLYEGAQRSAVEATALVAELRRLRNEALDDAVLRASERDTAREQLAQVTALDTPWPLRDVLVRLSDAADHLLGDHSCDRHGYEGVCAARDAARLIVATLARFDAAPTAQQSAPSEPDALRAWAAENVVGYVDLTDKAAPSADVQAGEPKP